MGVGMSRAWETVLDELLAYLPPGFVWPRGRDSMVAALLEPLARGIASLEAEAEDRRRTEVSPATAIQSLDDYERILGPDPCRPGGLADTIDERQRLAHARWTEKGGADVPYFIGLATARGVTISIEEFAPYRCGESECGESWSEPGEWRYPEGAAIDVGDGVLATEDDAIIVTGPLIMLPPRWQLGSAAIADYWRVAFGPQAIDWARCGEAEAGVTPHCIYDAFDEVECAITRRKPAHTIALFDYTAHAWQPPQPTKGAS